jgi:hypothetical protein
MCVHRDRGCKLAAVCIGACSVRAFVSVFAVVDVSLCACGMCVCACACAFVSVLLCYRDTFNTFVSQHTATRAYAHILTHTAQTGGVFLRVFPAFSTKVVPKLVCVWVSEDVAGRCVAYPRGRELTQAPLCRHLDSAFDWCSSCAISTATQSTNPSSP